MAVPPTKDKVIAAEGVGKAMRAFLAVIPFMLSPAMTVHHQEPPARAGQQSIVPAPERYATDSVTSRDGTIIGYRRLGHGPGVVLLHGTAESAQSHMQLAEALATTFTVYVPDRRGRGRSGPHGSDYSIGKEVEDMDALLTKTGAHCVFGVSSGALVWLQAALTIPSIHRVAVFEPALLVNGAVPTGFVKRYDEEIAEGKVAAALVTAMKGSQMGPRVFNFMPRWLLERLTSRMMSREDKAAKQGDVTMRMLAPTLHFDFQLVAESEGMLERLRALRQEVLLLGGSKSPGYLKTAVDSLERVLPHAERIEFPDMNHGGSGNTNRGGKPEAVAEALRRFYARANPL